MSLAEFLQKKVVVTQVRSSSKLTKKQKGNLIGLGLRGVNSSSELVCCESVLGMIKKIEHLIEIKN